MIFPETVLTTTVNEDENEVEVYTPQENGGEKEQLRRQTTKSLMDDQTVKVELTLPVEEKQGCSRDNRFWLVGCNSKHSLPAGETVVDTTAEHSRNICRRRETATTVEETTTIAEPATVAEPTISCWLSS